MAAERSLVEQLKKRLTQALVAEFDLSAAGHGGNGTLTSAIERRLRTLLDASNAQDRRVASIPADEQQRLIEEIVADFTGYGPISSLMQDAEVTEIMVNGPQRVYAERAGKLQRTEIQFRDEEHLRHCLERLLNPISRSVTESEPYLDASLPDGSRLNVIIPPLCLNGTTLTLRKHMSPLSLDQLVALDALTPAMAEFLMACIQARVNVIISGGTSTGKTTLVTALSSAIGRDERVVTIENVAELELFDHDHWIRLVSRSANAEGRGEIPLRTLVRNALRMRPDRIILGESRGGEAFDMVQAMNTGHDGIVTVLHANSPADALERLEMLMLMSGVDLPTAVCRAQVSRVIDLLVHVERLADGSRKISQITHIVRSDGGVTSLGNIFAYDIRGIDAEGRVQGQFRASSEIAPRLLQKFTAHGVTLKSEWFA